MERKYKASAALRVFSLGLCKHAVHIENGVLRTTCAPLPNMKPIKIKDILSVRCYEKGTYYRGTITYCIYYEFAVKGKTPQYLRYNVLDGDTMQRLLKDLKMINPNIFFTPEVKAFVNTPIPKYKIHLDFTPIDEQPKAKRYAKTQRPFILQHPSVDVAHNWLMIILVMAPIFIGNSIVLGVLLGCFGSRTNSMFIPPMTVSFFPLFNVGMGLSLALYGSSDGWQKIKKNLYIAAICLFLGLLFGSLGVII